MWAAEKWKSLLKKIKSSTVESELFQISNNLELLFVLAPTSLEQIKYLDYSQFEKVHFLTVGEIIILCLALSNNGSWWQLHNPPCTIM